MNLFWNQSFRFNRWIGEIFLRRYRCCFVTFSAARGRRHRLAPQAERRRLTIITAPKVVWEAGRGALKQAAPQGIFFQNNIYSTLKYGFPAMYGMFSFHFKELRIRYHKDFRNPDPVGGTAKTDVWFNSPQITLPFVHLSIKYFFEGLFHYFLFFVIRAFFFFYLRCARETRRCMFCFAYFRNTIFRSLLSWITFLLLFVFIRIFIFLLCFVE